MAAKGTTATERKRSRIDDQSILRWSNKSAVGPSATPGNVRYSAAVDAGRLFPQGAQQRWCVGEVTFQKLAATGL